MAFVKEKNHSDYDVSAYNTIGAENTNLLYPNCKKNKFSSKLYLTKKYMLSCRYS